MCSDFRLSDKTLYSTFARTLIQVDGSKLSIGLLKLLHKFNWTEVAIVYQNVTNWILIKNKVAKEFQQKRITVRSELELPSLTCYTELFFNYSLECESSIKDLKDYMRTMALKLKNNSRGKTMQLLFIYK